MKSTNIKTTFVQERALNDGDMCQVYEVGKYDVIVRGPRKSTGDHLWMTVRKHSSTPDTRYLPTLSENCFDDEGCACQVDMWVDTTSYGALTMEEIAKFMDAMDEGIATAQCICDKFLRPMVDGAWSWSVTG